MAIANPSAAFTRPADTTAYTSGDLVANSTTAGSVTALSWLVSANLHGNLQVRRARVLKSGTSITNASFRLHLYNSAPTVANGDNGAWSSTTSAYLGSLDIVVDKAFSDGAGGAGTLVSATGTEIILTGTVDKTIYGLLEARGAYTPASAEVFTVLLEILS